MILPANIFGDFDYAPCRRVVWHMHGRKYFRENIPEIYRRMKQQAPPHHFEFHDPFWVLITTMLSHRTKDEVTDSAARALFEKYSDCKSLSHASYEDVLAIIEKVGFKTAKARRIIQAADIICRNYGGSVPASREELMEIPGVGRKTANVVLADSLGIPAIAVDTHVHRISNRMGFSRSKDPQEVEEALMKIVPVEDWLGFNPVLVEFGKTVCKPIGPKCEVCSVKAFCSFYSKSERAR